MFGSTVAPPAGTIAPLSIIGASQIYGSVIDMKIEGGGGGNPCNSLIIDATSAIQQCEGKILSPLGGPSIAAGAEFTFRGMLAGTLGAVTTPAMPGVSGTVVQNLGPDAQVFFTALNSLTNVVISGQGIGAPAAGPFFLAAGATITPSWSAAAPAWTWLPASQSQF
jgi:hypothetical protein